MAAPKSLKKIWPALFDRPTLKVDGASIWRKDNNPEGELHRENGPAIVRNNGSREWWVFGKLHCENGPAVINADGSKQWYLEGQQLTEEDFVKQRKSKAGATRWWKFGKGK